MPCDYGGIGDRRDLQHNSFNNLYVNTSHNARKEHQIQTILVSIKHYMIDLSIYRANYLIIKK